MPHWLHRAPVLPNVPRLVRQRSGNIEAHIAVRGFPPYMLVGPHLAVPWQALPDFREASKHVEMNNKINKKWMNLLVFFLIHEHWIKHWTELLTKLSTELLTELSSDFDQVFHQFFILEFCCDVQISRIKLSFFLSFFLCFLYKSISKNNEHCVWLCHSFFRSSKILTVKSSLTT